MWQMVQRNLECIEVIPTKESVRSIDSSGELIFATTQSHKLKVAKQQKIMQKKKLSHYNKLRLPKLMVLSSDDRCIKKS